MDTATVPTPLGPFSMITLDRGIIAAGFTDDPTTLLAELPQPYRDGSPRVRATLEPYASAVRAYFDGAVEALDGLPVVQFGNDFRLAAWQEMRRVEPGTSVSYQELADRAGRPGAARAAGASCAYNLVPLIVPCHRIRRADGSLGGYYYGLDVKRWLLAHESGELLPLAPPPVALAKTAATGQEGQDR
ncbi:methylated-DNA--[protein]-cysteine S-methyltransferase [Streptomyces sp. NPDC002928]|uniref:methylated-DNA--[protein]-cysteine S-methyltransferase n=1 Tax=Streptomyces sp. NPDC002928 TaxID=3154440 RepID=UPI0033AAF661